MSSGYGHLACWWLALAVLGTGHGPLQFPAEVRRASEQLAPTPRLHILTVTQICTHKYAPIDQHIHIQEHTYAHKYVSTDIGQH